MSNTKVINSYQSFSDDDRAAILQLFNIGCSSREICSEMGWKRSRKSSVNMFLKPYRDGNLQVDSNGVSLHDCVSKSEVVSKEVVKQPRVLYFDLESSLMVGYFFGMWQQNISMRRIKKQSHLLSAAWAYNDGEVEGVRLTPEQVKTGDDFDVVVKMVEAINNSDLIVTFNGKKFDMKLLNTRALFWGIPPVKVVKHIDLFEQSKRVFKFPSNSMQNVSMYLGEEGKLQTSGSNLWERCLEWENYQVCNNALEEIFTYNKQDISATRDLHKRFQGWMKGVPNVGTIVNEVTENKTLRCIHCGSDDIFPMNDKTYTAVSSFDLYRCAVETCRGISRITKNGKHLTGVI